MTTAPESLTQEETLATLGRYDFGWADSDAAGSTARRGLSADVVADIRKEIADADQVAILVVEEAGPCLRGTQISKIEGSHVLRLQRVVADVQLDGVIDRRHTFLPVGLLRNC